ncbi:hypothetical protein MY4824_009819 [Beauveria thailandica]
MQPTWCAAAIPRKSPPLKHLQALPVPQRQPNQLCSNVYRIRPGYKLAFSIR